MKHIRRVTVAPASTNAPQSISLGYIIWLASLAWFKHEWQR